MTPQTTATTCTLCRRDIPDGQSIKMARADLRIYRQDGSVPVCPSCVLGYLIDRLHPPVGQPMGLDEPTGPVLPVELLRHRWAASQRVWAVWLSTDLERARHHGYTASNRPWPCA